MSGPGSRLARWWRMLRGEPVSGKRPRRGGTVIEPGPRHAVFGQIHELNHWGNRESLSGDGSTEQYTENIRRELPSLWERLGVQTVLDAPCGDYNWFRLIPRETGPQYIGGDIVKRLVKANRRRYGGARTEFRVLDIVEDPLPEADFWLCRDCLFHLSTADVTAALRNFARSRIAYLCTSVHPECTENTDIETGDFRLLNLELAPFHFGPPLATIDDWIEGYYPRVLALWRREDVARALEEGPRE